MKKKEPRNPLLTSNPFRKLLSFRRTKKVAGNVRKLDPRRYIGKVWLRLSYYDSALTKLDEENQKIFIEEFYSASRQVNYITLMVCVSLVGVYLSTFQFRLIGFWEAVGLEGILVMLLFYVVWYYRMGMEDLLKYLIRKETTPDYALEHGKF